MADKVVLRRWRTGSKSLIALFPEQPADDYGYEVNSYESVGAHGPADYDHVISQTTPVLWHMRSELAFLNELQMLGYDTEVHWRRTPQMRAICRAEADRIRQSIEA
jgi:hypothetical protein